MSDRVKELVEAGSVLSRAGDADGAIRLLEEALRLAPQDPRARELHAELTRGRKASSATPFAPPPPDLFADAKAKKPTTNPFARSGGSTPTEIAGLASPAGRTPEMTDPFGNTAAQPTEPLVRPGPAGKSTMPFAGPASPAFATVPSPQAKSQPPAPVRFTADPASSVEVAPPPPGAPGDGPSGGYWSIDVAPPVPSGRTPPPPPPSSGSMPAVSHRFGTPPKGVPAAPKSRPPAPPTEAVKEPSARREPPRAPDKKLPPPAFVELFADVTPQPVPEHRPRSNPEMHDPLNLIEVPPKAEPAPPSDEVEDQLRDAKSQLDFADHSGALATLEKLLTKSPAHPEALRLKAKCEATLVSMFESKLGNLNRRPTLKLRPDEVIWLNLDHRAGFVLAQIDGTVTLEDVFALSGMSRLDTARILAQLVEEKVIQV